MEDTSAAVFWREKDAPAEWGGYNDLSVGTSVRLGKFATFGRPAGRDASGWHWQLCNGITYWRGHSHLYWERRIYSPGQKSAGRSSGRIKTATEVHRSQSGRALGFFKATSAIIWAAALGAFVVICLLSKVRQLYPGRAGFPHECGFLRSKAVGLVNEVAEQSFELQCFGGEDAGGFDGAAAVRASFLPRRRRCRSRGQ